MIKFPRSDAADIELCGAGSYPLPVFLNRQIIKILEDLQVDDASLLRLQSDAVRTFRAVLASPGNTCKFLTVNGVNTSMDIPWLFQKLTELQLPFQGDPLLKSILETAVLVPLRDIKYKARIPVPNGAMLYGILDETGFLEQEQVYCTISPKGQERRVILGPVLLTRNPALHPGDVQAAYARQNYILTLLTFKSPAFRCVSRSFLG